MRNKVMTLIVIMASLTSMAPLSLACEYNPPNYYTLTVNSNPTGINISVNGNTVVTSYSYNYLEGTSVSLTANTQIVKDSVTYYFQEWKIGTTTYSYNPSISFSMYSGKTMTVQYSSSDNTSPDDVTNLTAVPGDGQVGLSWTMPTYCTGVKILRKVDDYPTSLTDSAATPVYNGYGTSTVDSSNITNGIHYYYKAFSYDAKPNYSDGSTNGAEADAIPHEMTVPSPSPLTWATLPHATSATSISMIATTATDASEGIQYYFAATSTGGHNGDWNSSATYEDTGLSPSTPYSYKVKAKDIYGNVSCPIFLYQS
jgi:hypothetical protein